MGSEPKAEVRLYDAHNHLQDERLASQTEEIMRELRREHVVRMVVNGSCEEDWPAVLALVRRFPEVIPSFGYHPWYVKERSANWLQVLTGFLDQTPSALGEIGLDRWIKNYDLVQQEEVFTCQLRLAAERNLPVSIHCLQAWGKLLELLQAGPRPQCGFVLHSFGGPREMIDPLAELGGYFSLPGYFAHARKDRQREAFKHVPSERLLIETDAPDQPLPPERARYHLPEPTRGKPLNHPANLRSVYEFAAELLNCPLEKLACQVEANFQRLFARLLGLGRTFAGRNPLDEPGSGNQAKRAGDETGGPETAVAVEPQVSGLRVVGAGATCWGGIDAFYLLL